MVNESEIIQKLGDRNAKIKSCILNAVMHYQEKLSDESLILSSLTKSSYIRDFIIKNITDEFTNDGNVEIIKKRGMIVLSIYTDPIIMLKFKKFNKYNRVAAAKTMQALAYSNQEQGELFPYYSETVNLHAGYKWDESYTQVDCLIGLPNSLRGHSWIALIPESGNIHNVVETTPEQIITKKKLKLKTMEKKVNDKIS